MAGTMAARTPKMTATARKATRPPTGNASSVRSSERNWRSRTPTGAHRRARPSPAAYGIPREGCQGRGQRTHLAQLARLRHEVAGRVPDPGVLLHEPTADVVGGQDDPEPSRLGPTPDVSGELEGRRPAVEPEVEGDRRERVEGESEHGRVRLVGHAAGASPGSALASTACRWPNPRWPGRGGCRRGRGSGCAAGSLVVRRPTTGTVRRREVRGLGLPVGVDVLEVAEGRDRPHPLDGLPLDVLGDADLPGGEPAARAHHLCDRGEGAGCRGGHEVGTEDDRVDMVGRLRGGVGQVLPQAVSPAATTPPLTALPIIHDSLKAPCRVAGVSPGSSRMASSYSLTGKVSSRRPRRRGLPGAVGALCHGCAMDTAALFGGLVVGLVLGGFIAFLWVRGSSCRGRRPQRPSETLRVRLEDLELARGVRRRGCPPGAASGHDRPGRAAGRRAGTRSGGAVR